MVILDKFRISDLLNDPSQIKVLLILESPHLNEYIHEHPIAGKAGQILCKAFVERGYLNGFEHKKSLGCEISRLSYKHLGILNSSALPLDVEFYPCTGASQQIEALGLVKMRLQKSTLRNFEPKNQCEFELVNDFKERFKNFFQSMTLDHLIIVPCGHVARNFIQSIDVGNALVIDDLDHPNSRNWKSSVSNTKLWGSITKEMLP